MCQVMRLCCLDKVNQEGVLRTTPKHVHRSPPPHHSAYAVDVLPPARRASGLWTCGHHLDVRPTHALHRLCSIVNWGAGDPAHFRYGIPMLSARRHDPDTTVCATLLWFYDNIRATNKSGSYMLPASDLSRRR